MVGKAATLDASLRLNAVQRQERHQQQAFEIEFEFSLHWQGTVRFEMPIAAVPKHHMKVVERPVENMLAHVAPDRGGFDCVHLMLIKCIAHFLHAEVHQPGVAV